MMIGDTSIFQGVKYVLLHPVLWAWKPQSFQAPQNIKKSTSPNALLNQAHITKEKRSVFHIADSSRVLDMRCPCCC